MNRFLEIWFGNYRWCRKMLGGRWEKWWIDCCGSAIWLKHDSRLKGRVPCSCGRPIIEQYREHWMANVIK